MPDPRRRVLRPRRVASQSFWETGLTMPANAILAAIAAAIVVHDPALPPSRH